jgi:hypothetical protein
MAGISNEERLARATRESREQELRVADDVHEDYATWEDDTLLNTSNIPPRDGYVQRWVRTSVKGIEDQANVQKKFNRGWRPRPMSTIPKGQYVMHVDFNGMDVVGVHGMILMERPKALHEKQRKMIQQDTDMQMKSVKHDMYKVHEPGSRLTRPEFVEENTKTSRGRIAPVDD